MSQLASKIPVGLAMFLPKIVQHVTAGQQDTSWISNFLTQGSPACHSWPARYQLD
ncbi:hypothetical protein DPMN_118402 [Dreissena polymorpha]|uniref:Uncharacterized protein n=1 Tax=Dreissena polymorpha TaxID=45954 RepID=A0A9D4JR22_DREPO|nr:hypothetical protein DPMN_118402 [Dreissena polymorpha]